jgi:DNA-binding transcriptional LysR family regulator
MPEFDWNDLRAFLAVVRTGRLVTAAHQLGMDQSTLSRRISGLEKALQTRLFDRTPTGYALTISGETLVSQAEEIERLTIDIGSRLANAHSALAGPIRIATPEGFGTYFLPPLLNKLTQAHPELEIELVAVPGAVSLFKREADLAVMISPPEKGRFKTRRLLDYELGLYASRSYLIPTRTEGHALAQSRRPMDMMVQG